MENELSRVREVLWVVHEPRARNRGRHRLRPVRLISLSLPPPLTLRRLLAHAGFDPRHAVRFWENRAESAPDGECAHAPKEDVDERGPIRKLLPHRWSGSSYHPLNIERVRKLKQELERWEAARRRAREDEEREARAAPAWWNRWAAA